MSNTNYPGIDYSGPGSTTNRDPETGIRYGVISQHSIQPDVMNDIWMESRDLSYEAAVEEVKKKLLAALESDNEDDRRESFEAIISDFVRDDSSAVDEMMTLKQEYGEGAADALWDVVEQDFNDRYESGDSHDWLWEKDGYRLENCLQTDVFVSKSPFYTWAQFCSPCVPGACNLDSPLNVIIKGGIASTMEAGPHGETFVDSNKCYCLGHDFFENEEAPYPVFSVATGKRVVMTERREPCPRCNGVPDLKIGSLACWRCGGLGYEVKKVQQEQ